MTKQICILILFLMPFSVFSQEYSTKNKKAIANYEEATLFYDDYDVENCQKSLDKALKYDDKFVEAYLLYAGLLTDIEDYSGAVDKYKCAIKYGPKVFPNMYLNVARLENLLMRHDDAIEHLNEYKKDFRLTPVRLIIVNHILECAEFGKSSVANPVEYEPINLGPNVNSEFDEYLPTLTADEQTLIITRRRKADAYTIDFVTGLEEDFYVSVKDENGEWSLAKPLGPPVNTHGNEGAQCISPDGMFFIFTACHREDGYGGCDLYISRKYGDYWTIPENLGDSINTPYWESQPTLASDGRTLYFVSNRKGGLGMMDIYTSVMDEYGNWSMAKPIGSGINTPKSDLSPFIHADNQTLYFSSEGHVGMGGRDLFYTKKQEDGSWGKPVNLGYPINTPADEANMVVNAMGDYAYFSSNAIENGLGKMDLYSFKLYDDARPNKVNYLKGIVFDSISGKRIKAKFELINLNSGNLIVESFSDSISGEFLVVLPANNDYALNVEANSYLFYSANFNMTAGHSLQDPFLYNIALNKIQENSTVVLHNVFFETAEYTLLSESYIELKKLIELLEKNPNIKIEIGGHTDNVGNDSYNITLSENRAKTVYNYLIDNNIDQNRLTYKGYGETMPLFTNDTEEGRAGNRRTEFKIIEYSKQ